MNLKEILKNNGVADDKIKKITDAMKENKIFTSNEENIDIRYGKLKENFDNLTTQHTEATKLIEELKKGTAGNEELQGKVTAYETQISALQEELRQTQIKSAVKVALLGAKATDVDYLIFKLKEKGELELAKDGTVKGLDDKIAELKTQFPNQFEKETQNQNTIEVNTLPNHNNNSSVTKDEFEKMGYQDRLKLYNDDPETYSALSKED
ncbi:MAG: hypothetical protein DBY14_06255 [Escherichia coli]|nr:MAG: hypothetical protein DBY14_06255 [Escherichia coli]